MHTKLVVIIFFHTHLLLNFYDTISPASASFCSSFVIFVIVILKKAIIKLTKGTSKLKIAHIKNPFGPKGTTPKVELIYKAQVFQGINGEVTVPQDSIAFDKHLG